MVEYQNIVTRMFGADSFPYRNITITEEVNYYYDYYIIFIFIIIIMKSNNYCNYNNYYNIERYLVQL